MSTILSDPPLAFEMIRKYVIIPKTEFATKSKWIEAGRYLRRLVLTQAKIIKIIIRTIDDLNSPRV